MNRYASRSCSLTLLVSVLSGAAQTGCVTVPVAPPHLDKSAKQFSISPRNGRVYCYRKYEYFACAITLPLTVDGHHVVDLAPDTYVCFDLDPGVHTFATSGPYTAPYSINLDIQPRALYFLRQDPRMGYWQNKFYLVETDARAAKVDMERCRLVQAFNEPAGVRSPLSTTIAHGTGFAVSSNGHILTAYHVVENCDRIRVRFSNEEWLDAKLLKHSRACDVALLKISTGTPTHLPLCDVGSVRQGQKVFTIGYPVPGVLGETPKYTEGVISSQTGLTDEASLLQVTVPIQPGNSGGALVNSNGKVVGLITSSAAVKSFFAATGTIPQNVNWAVNADYIRPLLGEVGAPFESKAVIKPLGTDGDVVSFVRSATCLVEVRSSQ